VKKRLKDETCPPKADPPVAENLKPDIFRQLLPSEEQLVLIICRIRDSGLKFQPL
jgi:hypothetical protein